MNKLKEFFRRILSSPCPTCPTGRVHYMATIYPVDIHVCDEGDPRVRRMMSWYLGGTRGDE